MKEIQFERVTPVLRVTDVEASVRYYVDVLGFKENWRDGTGFASVSRGRCELFLCQGDQGHAGAWVWIGVSDAEALHEELRKKDAKIRHRPANYEWAYEMQVEDLDGNVLRMGSDSKEGEKSGEWLDMYGNLWRRSGPGWVKSGPAGR